MKDKDRSKEQTTGEPERLHQRLAELITEHKWREELAIAVESVRSKRELALELEITLQELEASLELYQGLFKNALDAIWLHDFQGNIIIANDSASKLTGYSVEELMKMDVRGFLSEESLQLAGQIRQKLLANEPVEQPYEQRLFRRDGREVFIQLVTSLVLDRGEPVAFQHIARDITEQKRMQENLRFYTQQTIKAREEERKSISTKLIEETVQDLFGIARGLEVFTSTGQELPEEEYHNLMDLRERTNNLAGDLRKLGLDLWPTSLDHLGLLPSLEWLATDMTEQSGIAVKVNVLGTTRRLSEEVELMLFRIAQESLRNVWRHSQARTCEITVKFDESGKSITISDDGKGANLPRIISDLVRDGKLGFARMQQQAGLIGGTLIIKSQPGVGTSISVELTNEYSPD